MAPAFLKKLRGKERPRGSGKRLPFLEHFRKRRGPQRPQHSQKKMAKKIGHEGPPRGYIVQNILEKEKTPRAPAFAKKV